MLLKNTGNKIVNIGKDIILPGEQRSYPKEIADSAAMQMMIGFGFLTAFEEPKDSEPVETAPAADEDAGSDEEEKKVTRNRKTAKKAE